GAKSIFHSSLAGQWDRIERTDPADQPGAAPSLLPPRPAMSAHIVLPLPISAATARVMLALFAAAAIPVTARAQVAQYTITDLGTLGGTRSEAYGINASGQVTGIATVPDQTSRAFRSTPNGQPPS